MLMTDVEAFMDTLVDEGVDGSEVPATMAALERQLSRFEGVVSVAAEAFETGGQWSEDGAYNGTAWLNAVTHLPKALLRRQVRLGRGVGARPALKEKWLCGGISGAHVEALTRVIRPMTQTHFERDEALLLASAEELRFDEFAQLLAYWELHANPDGSEQAAQDQRDRRDVYLEPSISGLWLGGITLDPISGAIVSKELKRIEAELFKADCDEATERLGRRPLVIELRRTSAQRRADALVELAIRSASTPEGSRRPEPLFNVLVGWETLHGPVLELAQGQALTPGSLIPWLSGAELERAVFGAKGRVEISERFRFFVGATRRALELRDRECTHPFCDVPADQCQGDHIQEWVTGGATTQENGRLLCPFHNGLRNQRPPPQRE